MTSCHIIKSRNRTGMLINCRENIPWLVLDIDILLCSLHLQLRFSSRKSELCDFKISNSNVYDKNPSSVHFRICNSDFTAKIRVVCISKFATRILPQKFELLAFQNL